MIALFFLSVSITEREDIIDCILDDLQASPYTKPFSRNPEFIMFLRSKVEESADRFKPFIDNETTETELHRSQRLVTKALIEFVMNVTLEQHRPTITNFVIPEWVIELLKLALQKLIEYVSSHYEITIQWDPKYKGQFQACVISLVTKQSNQLDSVDDFFNYVKTAALKFIKSFPIKFDFTTYEGNPSVVIYWNPN